MSNIIIAIQILFFTLGLVASQPQEADAPTIEPVELADVQSQETILERRLMTVTGYSSTPEETDDSPHWTALGTKVRWGIVATNDLPFGTEVKISDLFGDEIFIVEDRMNARYTERSRMDVWFPSKKEALHFGVNRNVVIEVLTRPNQGSLARAQ